MTDSRYVPLPERPYQAHLECGHSRTLDNEAKTADCWSGCGEQVVISAVRPSGRY